jgi:stage II sporulation protein D (peptidoglycan lytic transglycosylase)
MKPRGIRHESDPCISPIRHKAMFSLAATLILLCMPVRAPAGTEPVGIGLFSLFKPAAVQVRLQSGRKVDVSSQTMRSPLAEGELVRIKVTGGSLAASILDRFGRFRRSITATELSITSDAPPCFELSLSGGRLTRSVRGDLLVSVRPVAGRVQMNLVLLTNLESAVASVVEAEMTSRAPEALKSMAVMARTFMLAHRGRHAREGFDFCDTTHCQVYRGEAEFASGPGSSEIAAAVSATEGEYLSFRGGMIEGYYTAVCGGLGATPEMVWRGQTASGYGYRRIACDWCRSARDYQWTRRTDIAPALRALSAVIGFRLSSSAQIEIERDTESEFVRSVVVSDRGRRVQMSADEFRRALGLRLGWNTVLSPSFIIQKRGRWFTFTGRGFGSQIGFCVAGAAAQAEAGRDYESILAYYYPGAAIARPDQR